MWCWNHLKLYGENSNNNKRLIVSHPRVSVSQQSSPRTALHHSWASSSPPRTRADEWGRWVTAPSHPANYCCRRSMGFLKRTALHRAAKPPCSSGQQPQGTPALPSPGRQGPLHRRLHSTPSCWLLPSRDGDCLLRDVLPQQSPPSGRVCSPGRRGAVLRKTAHVMLIHVTFHTAVRGEG